MSHLAPFIKSRLDRKEAIEIFQSLITFIKSHTSEGSEFIYQKDSESFTVRHIPQQTLISLKRNCECEIDDDTSMYCMHATGEDIDKISDSLIKSVKRCKFGGEFVVLGVTGQNRSQQSKHILAPGINNNVYISNCIIEPGAVVYNNIVVSDTIICSKASLVGCGIVKSSEDGLRECMTINIGPESGGSRSVSIQPESTIVDVMQSIINSQTVTASGTPSDNIPWNIVLGDIYNSNDIQSVYISVNSKISNCSKVCGAILMDGARIANTTAEDVYLQWGSAIVNNSSVSSVLLMECSEIGPNSVVSHTVLGPDSHLSCGEVHCSLIGPNTNSHHQSLIISAIWPCGRGNVGYGSNIGSNHTGRIPDQEITIGEGIFWGLGCVIKFPVDVSKAYYSVIAAGVQLPPQSISVPFSLIVSGERGNELVPGWVLESSPYTILRNEEKYKKRRNAKRHDFYCGWQIIRPTIVDACREMRDILVVEKQKFKSFRLSGQKSSEILITKDIIQLGDNYVTQRGIEVGIKAYTTLVHRYALHGLMDVLYDKHIEDIRTVLHKVLGGKNKVQKISSHDTSRWPSMPWEDASHGNPKLELEHKIHVLQHELSSILDGYPGNRSGEDIGIFCLEKLISLEKNHATNVLRSKIRDDKRGIKTVPGYAEVHVMAESDSIIKLAEENAAVVSEKCRSIIKTISQNICSKL